LVGVCLPNPSDMLLQFDVFLKARIVGLGDQAPTLN
jgi:hypothetical protein